MFFLKLYSKRICNNISNPKEEEQNYFNEQQITIVPSTIKGQTDIRPKLLSSYISNYKKQSLISIC